VGCCALYLAFGFVAGMAHVHESADHHEEPRGLHLDHGHLGESKGHDHHHEHPHDRTHGVAGDHAARIAGRHADHHEGDAVYLNATAARSFDSSVHPTPEIVHVGAVIDPSSPASPRDDAVTTQPRDPPRKNPPRLRAPPA